MLTKSHKGRKQSPVVKYIWEKLNATKSHQLAYPEVSQEVVDVEFP